MKLVIAIVMTMFGGVSSVYAQSNSGNGGGMVICEEFQGTPAYSMQFDLYEGVTRYLLPAPSLPGATVEEILKNAYARIREKNKYQAARVEAAVRFVRNNLNFTDQSKVLFPTLDASKIMIDSHCKFHQVATWDTRSGKLHVVPGLFETLAKTPRDEAALYLHEAIYLLKRRYEKQGDSDDARELNARIFAQVDLPEKLIGEMVTDSITKVDSDINFKNDKVVALNFIRLNWKNPLSYAFEKEALNQWKVLVTIRVAKNACFTCSPRRVEKLEKKRRPTGISAYSKDPVSGELLKFPIIWGQKVSFLDHQLVLSDGFYLNLEVVYRSPESGEEITEVIFAASSVSGRYLSF